MLSNKLSKSLFCEYIEETGFLVTYIRDYFQDREIPWPKAFQLENRIDAYLDALELGGSDAALCMEDLLGGDEDELTGALFTLTSIKAIENGIDIALNHFENADVDDVDDEDLLPFILAFKHSLNPLLDEKIVQCLNSENPAICAATIEILSYRRGCDPKRIWPFIHNEDPAIRDLAVKALARFGYKEAIPAIEQLSLSLADTDKQKLLKYLIVLGSKNALDECRRLCMSSQLTKADILIYLAMAGDINDAQLIHNYIRTEPTEDTAIKAAGILGNVNSVPLLMEKLKSDDIAVIDAAGKALYQITGSDIYEPLQMPDEDDDDDDDDDEINNDNTEADASESKESEDQVTALGTSLFENWNTWWTENQKRFDTNTRFRYGLAHDPNLLMKTIADTNSFLEDRYYSWFEYVIQTETKTHLEPDWFVSKQLPVIKELLSS